MSIYNKYSNTCSHDDSCIYVDIGEIVISKNKLYTAEVGSCSVLMFHLLEHNIMVHIDAIITKADIVIDSILKHFTMSDLKTNNYKIFLIVGPWCNNHCYNKNSHNDCECNSITIANQILTQLQIIDKLHVFDKEKYNVSWNDTIWFNKTINISN